VGENRLQSSLDGHVVPARRGSAAGSHGGVPLHIDAPDLGVVFPTASSPSDSAAARGRAQHRAAAARPRAGAQDWPPARSLAREGGRRVLSRLSPPHRAFIGRVLRNTRRRLHREGRPYAGGVPARGSQVRRAGSRADACLSRQAIVRAGARSRLCSWQRDLRPRGVASALRRLCAREVD
jgi:hypothetical protein